MKNSLILILIFLIMCLSAFLIFGNFGYSNLYSSFNASEYVDMARVKKIEKKKDNHRGGGTRRAERKGYERKDIRPIERK